MKKKQKVYIALAVVAILGLSLFAIDRALRPGRGQIFETYIFEADHFKIKVEASHQEGPFLIVPGAYYDYAVKTGDLDGWRPILTFLFDDPVAIPKNQIKIISDQVAYLYVGWMYSVTTDGGKSWKTWDGNPKTAQYLDRGYGFIREIHMNSSGEGTMHLLNKKGGLSELSTKDYGKTWYEQ